MNLADVMDDLATALASVGGLDTLRVWAWPADQITPPAAIVSYPEDITFDDTYGRGRDSMTIPIIVAVGKVSDRTARDRLGQYCDGSGSSSIKYWLENYTPTAFDVAVVKSISFDIFTFNAIDYMGATFEVEITGSGA